MALPVKPKQSDIDDKRTCLLAELTDRIIESINYYIVCPVDTINGWTIIPFSTFNPYIQTAGHTATSSALKSAIKWFEMYGWQVKMTQPSLWGGGYVELKPAPTD